MKLVTRGRSWCKESSPLVNCCDALDSESMINLDPDPDLVFDLKWAFLGDYIDGYSWNFNHGWHRSRPTDFTRGQFWWFIRWSVLLWFNLPILVCFTIQMSYLLRRSESLGLILFVMFCTMRDCKLSRSAICPVRIWSDAYHFSVFSAPDLIWSGPVCCILH